jgi:hypothetical protein
MLLIVLILSNYINDWAMKKRLSKQSLCMYRPVGTDPGADPHEANWRE